MGKTYQKPVLVLLNVGEGDLARICQAIRPAAVLTPGDTPLRRMALRTLVGCMRVGCRGSG
jgi:hypothetical protein